MTTTAYIPSTSDKSMTIRQGEEVKRFALSEGLYVNRLIVSDRLEQATFLASFSEGDILLIPEISSLGNSLQEVVDFLTAILRRRVKLYTTDGHYAFDENIDVDTIVRMIEMVVEINSGIISKRTRKAIAKSRDSGVKVGRPRGSTTKFSVIESNLSRIVKSLAEGESIACICRDIGISYTTWNRYFNQQNCKQNS